jgi:hypothetical protein
MMKKKSLFRVSCLMLLVATVLISGIYGTPTALASEFNPNPALVSSKSSESNPTPVSTSNSTEYPTSGDELTNYCGDIGYLPPKSDLSEEENRGRCTWYLWTGGNEEFYNTMAAKTKGVINLLQLIDSRQHDQRFKKLGVINDPGCEQVTEPDKYGLWLDKCKDSHSAGVVGIRKFENPKFDPAKWDSQKYFQEASVEPPYRIGLSCGICHIAFDPLKPPKDPEKPLWENLVPALGNQYLEEGKFFGANLKPDDFKWQVLNAQPPGTSDTSRIATDHINNPNVINSIFNLADRPTHEEVMNDGTKQAVNHILKDGADSIGIKSASLRVYVNIGMCSDYWLTLHEALLGRTPQRPFDIERARKECEYWPKTEARMADAEAFLKTLQPLHLKDAPGGEAFLTKDESVLERGKVVFANSCASCHSSKQPPAEIAADPQKARQWYLESVKSADFLNHNFLSDDKRYPITEIGTNAERALGSNAIPGHIWEQFSSKTYKELPSPGQLTLENPFEKSQPIKFNVPSGGRGYYRTPTLISAWATAPFLHNNSLGVYNKDSSVEGRLAAYTDAIEKLLWPEKRENIIPRTTQDSTFELPLGIKLPIPKGTPIDLLANIDLRDAITQVDLKNVLRDLNPSGGPKAQLIRLLLSANQSPDFIKDRGHTYGSELSDEDKRALIEFVKTF